MNFRLLNLVVFSFILVSCGGEDKASQTVDYSDVEVTEESAENSAQPINEMADFKFHTMIANLPSPLQTFQIIADVDINLNNVKLTPTDVASDLSTASARAYGYGIYIADMGFMAYQHQNQQTLDYLHVCRELAGQLGAGDVFDRSISANFEENSTNEKQFVMMMDEAFNAMDEYMVNNERFVNATEIFVGSWVESQLIATGILKDQEPSTANLPVYQGIYDQKQHASNLMNVLGEIDAEVNEDVLSAVEDLMMFYAGFSTVDNISQKDLTELTLKLNTLKGLLLS
ncbi:MAG TPA: hypothetical protein DCR48_03090 [Flavobacteriales bacterium]|jgi:hypothetical protein|nr:hypothetical protein [Salibacteraceae bacterium]HAQ69939.1 hypothetical protein [Flavobacteriales bacterium]